ncbi:MAG TPA: SAM-dependent chlorinase/fluorinase [bacterium]|nr:SAM-dependent chlorinase/fluorinase [bacterium]
MNDPAIITLLTDFGSLDCYTGCIKGVILSINPSARIVDVSHDIQPFNLTSASYLITTYYKLFPSGTVHVAVVDPGVGGVRDPIAVSFEGYVFILPDNGLLTMTLEGRRDDFKARRIENPSVMREKISHTFHGRDIFAPAAAHVSLGVPFENLGPETFRIETIENLHVSTTPNSITGAIVHIDRFGNYITNIKEKQLERFDPATLSVRLGRFTLLGLNRTFSDKDPGELLAYIGSGGRLEIAVSKGSAADVVKLSSGAEVTVRGKEPAA